MYAARRHRVLGLLYDVLLAITIAMVDVVVTEGLESVQHYGCARSRLLAVRCRWIYVARCGWTGRARCNSDAEVEERTKRRQGTRDYADAFFEERPEADLPSAVYELARVAVECEVLETNNGCAGCTRFQVSKWLYRPIFRASYNEASASITATEAFTLPF